MTNVNAQFGNGGATNAIYQTRNGANQTFAHISTDSHPLPGYAIERGDSVQTILSKCNLDWKVQSSPVTYTTAKGAVRSFENRVALYREDNGNALGFASKNRYNIHQNEAIIGTLHKAAGARFVSAGYYDGGRSVFGCIELNQDDLTGPDGSKIKPYIICTTRHDVSGASTLFDRGNRVQCGNAIESLVAATKDTQYRVNHSVKLDPVAFAKAFGLLGQQWKQEVKVWNQLYGKKWSRGKAHAYFASLLDINLKEIDKTNKDGKPLVSVKAQNQLEALVEAYDSAPGAAPGTAWGALQAVTYYVDHTKGVRDSFGDGADVARLAASIGGDGAKLRQRAGQLLLAA